MFPTNAFKEVVALLKKLQQEKIIKDFAIIGGFALSAWTEPRTTKDVDMMVIMDNDATWEGLLDAIRKRFHKRVFSQKGTQRTHIKEKLSFVMGEIEVDLINTRDFQLAEDAVKNALPIKVFGKPIKVASPEYLILLKLLPLSEQDAIDIKHLIKIADVKTVKALAEKYHLIAKLKPLVSKK